MHTNNFQYYHRKDNYMNTMATNSRLAFLFPTLLLSFAMAVAGDYSGQLIPNYYDEICPQALPTIKRVVETAVQKEQRMGASLLRLHFHDCFVHGCDASILLDETPNFQSEKSLGPNNNSARGFDVIDQIKSEVDKACGGSIVSCADILAVAARDSVYALGGPWWDVLLGRRDSTTSYASMITDIPNPNMNLIQLVNSFKNQGLDIRDLVALSGGHTLGFAQCFTYRNRLYDDTNIDPSFAQNLKRICPSTQSDSESRYNASLDGTPATFDSNYYSNLLQQKGLLHSDQVLVGSGGATEELVKIYSGNPQAFWIDFANSIVKMGNIKPLTGDLGEIRSNCRRTN